MPETDTLEDILERSARRLNAAAVVVYEAGFTLKTDPLPQFDDPDWTGVIYFVGAWPDNIEWIDHRSCYPAFVPMRSNQELRRAIQDQAVALVRNTPEQRELFEGMSINRVSPAAAILVASLVADPLSSVTVIYFGKADEAERCYASWGLARRGEHEPDRNAQQDTADAIHDLQGVREWLGRNAERRHFQSHERFQKTFFPATSHQDINEEVRSFNRLVQQEIKALADDLSCPDLRAYLIEDLGDLDPDGAPERIRSDTPQRFAMMWASTPGAPLAAATLNDDGPIGWCLRTGKNIMVHNRVVFSGFKRAMAAKYNGLTTMDSIGLDEFGHPVMLLTSSGEVPSLIVYPITVGDRTIGAIVCNGRSHPPFVFHPRDEATLGLAASTIGGTWLALAQRQRALRGRALLIRAAEEMNKFSELIDQQMQSYKMSEESIYRAALAAADRIVGGEAFSSIRLFDPESQSFYYGPVSGDVWKIPEVAKVRTKRFRIETEPSDAPTTGVAYVHRYRKPLLVNADRPPPHFLNSFEGRMRHALFVPIFRAGKSVDVIGTLDIRDQTRIGFPGPIAHAIGMLASMLGLAIALIEARNAESAASQAASTAQSRNLLVYEDLTHQLLSPLRNAITQIERIDVMINPGPGADRTPLQYEAARLRGHLRRSYRVGLIGKFFRDLRTNRRVIQPRNARPIPLHDLQGILLRLIDDQELVSEPDEKHNFVFNSRNLESVYRNDIRGDRSLLEQMVSNLLENADKYSYAGTTITLLGGRSRDRSRFFLEVENYGYPIGREEVGLIRQRGGRGREAALRVAEGQGIGLYVVDEIIRSFRGTLEIIPGSDRTTPHRFRLFFPPVESDSGS